MKLKERLKSLKDIELWDELFDRQLWLIYTGKWMFIACLIITGLRLFLRFVGVRACSD